MRAGAEMAGWGAKRKRELVAFLDGYETIFAERDSVPSWEWTADEWRETVWPWT
jgi:hypothetical protein